MAKDELKFDESHPLFAQVKELKRQHELEKFTSVPEIKMLMDLHKIAEDAAAKYETQRETYAAIVDEHAGAGDLLPLKMRQEAGETAGTRTRTAKMPMGTRWVNVSDKLKGNPKPVPPAMQKAIEKAKTINDLPSADDRHKAGVYTLPEMVELSGIDDDLIEALVKHKDYTEHFDKVRDGQKGKSPTRIPPMWHYKTNA